MMNEFIEKTHANCLIKIKKKNIKIKNFIQFLSVYDVKLINFFSNTFKKSRSIERIN